MDGERTIGIDNDFHEARQRILVVPVVEAKHAGADLGEMGFSDLWCLAGIAFTFGGGFAPPKLVDVWRRVLVRR